MNVLKKKSLFLYNMISPNTIQQIIQRLDIIDVLGDFIQLKKRGVNFIGRCPFHNEKTPSFTVSPSKEIYKCFGCGKSGNTIQFIMDHEKYSYIEAIRWLANRYNIEIEETATNPEYIIQQQEKDSLFIINEFAKKFFIEQLWQSEQGKKIALPYLKYRNFLESTIEKFQLGYASNQWNVLYNSFQKNQYNIELVKKTGLITQKEDAQYFDTYRERIIFPIHNITGKVIGFGARIIGKNDKTSKYINTPENELYSKSNILYGMYYAKSSIQQQEECILVEGYTDVISLHQAGIENVVASGGTALTINQLRLIKKYTKNVTIIYDGDKAGIKAALRGLDIALTEGLNVHFLLIPDQEDPDSFVYKIGAAAFKEFIQKEKKEFLIFQIDIQLAEIGNDIYKKDDLVNQVAESISKINRIENFKKQEYYIQECARLLKTPIEKLIHLVQKKTTNQLEKELKKTITSEDIYNVKNIEELDNKNYTLDIIKDNYPDYLQEKNLILLLIEYGEKEWDTNFKTARDFILNEIVLFTFNYPDFIELFNEYTDLHTNGKIHNFKYFLYHGNKAISDKFSAILPPPSELSENWEKILKIKNINPDEEYKNEIISSLYYFILSKIKKTISENQQKIKDTIDKQEQNFYIEILNHLNKLQKDLCKDVGTVILK